MEVSMDEKLKNDSTAYNVSGNTTQSLQWNTSTHNDDLYSDTVHWHVATVLIAILFFLIFSLNGILICILVRKTKWSKMDFFVLHLAIADLMMAIFFLFPTLMDRLVDEWLAGKVMCHMYMYLSMIVSYASTYMLVALSFDRVYAVVCPMSVIRRGVWYARLLVLLVWLMSALLSIQDLYYAELLTDHRYPNKEFCELVYGEMTKVLVIVNSVINVFIPASLVTVCFVLMICVVWRRESRGAAITQMNESDMKGTERVNLNSSIFNRAKLRSTKMAFVVVLVFLICWGPFTLNRIFLVFGVTERGPHHFITLVLAPLNSVANPIIIVAFNYKKLLQRSTGPANKFRLTSKRTRTTVLRKEQDSPEVLLTNGSKKDQLV